jgi:hypothetical protein
MLPIHRRLLSLSCLLFAAVCPGVPISNYGEDEPSWTEFGNLPAGRVEEYGPVFFLEAWQNPYLETDEPIEGLLTEYGGIAGPYAVQPPSYGGITFTSLEDYESAWIEYMLAMNARLTGAPSRDTTAAPASGGRTYFTQTVNPTMSLAEPAAPVPEISSGLAMLIGAALIGIGRAVRRRVKA